jgi:type II secretory pathway component PulF
MIGGWMAGPVVRSGDLLRTNQEMMTLLKAGLTLPEILELAADRPESPALASILRRILGEVKTGTPFSAACAKYPRVFDGLYLSSLKTGERTGDLAQPLARYQDYLRQRVTLQAKVSQALVYPAFLLFVLAMVLGLLFIFVMPRFTALYADFNATLPLPTRFLMDLVHHLPWLGGLAAGMGLAFWALFKTWNSTESGRIRMDGALQKMPILEKFINPFLASQLARTLSTLLSGGTPLTEALQVARESLPNRAFALRFGRVIRRVLEGETLSKALGEEKLLPRTAVKLIQVGEASGQLEAMFREVAQISEWELENCIQRTMALVEPVFILLTGLLIGTVIVVMYLPIIHLSDVVH